MQVFKNFNVKHTNSKNMTCQKYQKHILSYLDGELHQEQANEFENHLLSCENCKLELTKSKMVYNLIEAEKSEFKPDPFMSARVVAKITNKELHASLNTYSLRYLAISSLAAAGMAIGVLIGTLYSSTTSLSENSTTSQEWDQLADEYMPEVENNPYNMVITTNQTPTKP